MKRFHHAVAAVAIVVALVVCLDNTAFASTSFDYWCYTYNTTTVNGVTWQADRENHGHWSTRIWLDSARTTGSQPWQGQNVCAINGAVVVEASTFGYAYIGSSRQSLSLWLYSGMQNGSTYVSGSVTDNYSWTSYRFEMHHRAWFSGGAHDNDPVAVITPY